MCFWKEIWLFPLFVVFLSSLSFSHPRTSFICIVFVIVLTLSSYISRLAIFHGYPSSV